MKCTAITISLLCFVYAGFSQSDRTRLIVRGDDMGYTHSGNEALIKSYKKGMETSIEVIVPSPWFPEAVKLLQENPGVDVGVHLAITSEWENIKWRPLTDCKSLQDSNGYFFPMINPNAHYPGQSVKEQRWKIADIEKEFRAQIEMAKKLIPRISHISGHMGCSNLSPEVATLSKKLAKEYGLVFDLSEYNVGSIGYDGASKTADEKKAAFSRALGKMEPGKTYLFVEHPGLDNHELEAVWHKGYEQVASDRQGVTDLFTDHEVQANIRNKGIILASYHDISTGLPRSTPSAENVDPNAIKAFKDAVAASGLQLHSFMVLRHGKVIAEEWLGNNSPVEKHIMHSVSKTFTSTAIGFAVAEGRLKLTDKVISFFPNDLPATISDHLKQMTVHDLLTMEGGHDTEPDPGDGSQTWVQRFLAHPVVYTPGTHFQYNSVGTYMLSAIIQKLTGQKMVDYLQPRLFKPLGISGHHWEESPQGINCGGWGLYLQTEDMAKMGQFMLQKGNWNGKQLLPAKWWEEATKAQTPRWQQSWVKPGQVKENSDWMQGYGYQVWRCRHNAFRADGRDGQFIIVIPDKDAVVAMTANIQATQDELNLVWQYLLPALK